MQAGSSSPTRDRTQVPCIGSAESYQLDHQGSPQHNQFYSFFLDGCIICHLISVPWFVWSRQLGCFHKFALRNDISVNISVHTSCCILQGNPCTLYPWRWNGSGKGQSILNSHRYCKSTLCDGCSHMHNLVIDYQCRASHTSIVSLKISKDAHCWQWRT